MNTNSILVFLFIVLIIYITLSPFSVSYHRRCLLETFSEQPIDFGILNRYAKRALAFKPPHTQAIASQRAESENALAFDSTANCNTTSRPSNLNNEAQSLVTENKIHYKLSSSCFAFKTQRLQDRELVLDIKSSQDWYKYVYFILLNPLFVEINKDNYTNTSFAYYPSYKTIQPITNKGHGDFSVASPSYDGSVINLQRLTGNLFDYRNNRTYTNIGALNIDNANINVKTYYVRPHDTTQTVGTNINYTTVPQNGQYLVSKQAYSTLPNNDKNQSLILFSKTIDNYFNDLERNSYPTFTTTFKLNLSANNSSNSFNNTQFMIFEMLMNNSFGVNTTCNAGVSYPPQFSKNGNIFSMTMQYPQNSAKLIKLKMGTSVGGCLFKNSSIELSLPYFQNNKTDATCIVTFSPYTIDFFAYWVNPNLEKNNNFEFIYQQNVDYNDNNDFSKLFKGVIQNADIKLADIVLNTDTSVIPVVNQVSLGYKNMAEILYKAIHEGR